ncbi:hypothetical protein ACFWSF_24765 [Streptomyces sp. NPDC058611]
MRRGLRGNDARRAQALGYHDKSTTRIATEAGAHRKNYAPGDHTR